MTKSVSDGALSKTRDSSQADNQILIVEDDPKFSDMLRIGIEEAGIKCVAASSIEEGCSIINAQRISLVLLDWRLKECTGAELLRRCRLSHPLLPVIVMTGAPLDQVDVRTDAILAQADGFLQKPFSTALVAAFIARWLKRLTVTIMLPQCKEEVHDFKAIKDQYIRHVVKLFDGNISLAAKRIGFHRSTVTAIVNNESSTRKEAARERL